MCRSSRKCGYARSRAFRLPHLPATRCGRSIRLSRHGLRMKGGEVGVDLSYGRGTLADAGRHALHRSAPYVSDRKTPGLLFANGNCGSLPVVTKPLLARVIRRSSHCVLGSAPMNKNMCRASTRRLSPLSRQVMSMLSSVPSAVPDNPVTAVRTRKSILGGALILSIRERDMRGSRHDE